MMLKLAHDYDKLADRAEERAGSTALVDILQWADHFEPWLSWPAHQQGRRQSDAR
jgi:hypothetical protein